MVLWEITLATAYLLGLKRTYKLALKIQRRLISPKHPRTRQFVYRRTRTVFDMAVKIHKNIQERDIAVGKNVGNWILRWLDKMKPSAEIRGGQQLTSGSKATKQLTSSSHPKTHGGSQTFGSRSWDKESGRHLFTSSRNMWRKPFPSIATMITPVKPAGINYQYRHLSIWEAQALKSNYGGFGSEGVIRKDIMEWMVRN